MNNKAKSIIKKIKALLEKTIENGATPNEAKSATLAVQMLLKKYNLTMTQVDAQGNDEAVDNEAVQYSRYWEVNLAGVVAHNMCCEGFYNSKIKKFIFIGKEAHRETAISTYEMLRGVCKQGVSFTIKQYGRQKGLENDYAFSFIRGVDEAMKVQSKALALIIPEETKKYTEEKFNLKKVSRRVSTSCNDKAKESGYNDGRSAVSRKALR